MQNISIECAFNLYCSDYIAFKGQSKKTEEAYVAVKVQMLKRFGDIDLCSLTFSDIRDFKLWLDNGRNPNTVRGYVVCLRNVLRFIRRRGYNVVNPDDIPVPKRQAVDIKYLTEEELEDLFIDIQRPCRGYSLELRKRNAAILRTIAATGLRNSELCSLNRDSIKNNTFTVIGKGSKPRIGFIDEKTLTIIDEYLKLRTDNNKALFVSRGGIRVTPDGVRLIFSNLRVRYRRWDGVHPHTIRHSYATKLLKHRVDIRYVKELMGHSSMDTTAHYTHLVNEDLKDVYFNALMY